ncbi:cspE [Symbiodinium pilosum]|uniref:CspE protein n=1 Tax=Symbiodinium pilosum TaxID=2952 RepID=A0A812W6J2_SYMPI|nr:cspE [Symbiodinium pilosum]
MAAPAESEAFLSRELPAVTTQPASRNDARRMVAVFGCSIAGVFVCSLAVLCFLRSSVPRATFLRGSDLMQGYEDTCFKVGMYYADPARLPSLPRTVQPDAQACQAECMLQMGCQYFTFWPDGGCLLTGWGATLKAVPTRFAQTVTGPKECPLTPPTAQRQPSSDSHRPQPSAAMSESGVVKFFNAVDSYGFIRLNGCPKGSKGSDVYVHRSAIADGKHLLRGDKVCFDVIEEDGRKQALRVTGGTGGCGLTFASNVDRSPIKGLLGFVKKSFPKGYGFIKQDDGGSDLFFHQNALAQEGEMPAVGTRVRYDNLWDEKRGCRKAFEVVLLETAEPAPKEAVQAAEEEDDDHDDEEYGLVSSDDDEWEVVA